MISFNDKVVTDCNGLFCSVCFNYRIVVIAALVHVINMRIKRTLRTVMGFKILRTGSLLYRTS